MAKIKEKLLDKPLEKLMSSLIGVALGIVLIMIISSLFDIGGTILKSRQANKCDTDGAIVLNGTVYKCEKVTFK